MANFAIAYPALELLEGSMEETNTYKSVYQRSFDVQKSGKFHSRSNEAVVDAFR